MSEYYPGPPPMESDEGPDAVRDPGPMGSEDAAAAHHPGPAPSPPVPGSARPDTEAAPHAGPARPIAPKEYYSISEVCEMVGLKPHVLRYWESQVPVLNPSKNRSGNRVYQRKEIKLVLLVQHLLYKEKYTIEGARQKLDQLRRGGKAGELAQATSSAVNAEMRKLLRDELTQLLEVLSPRAPDGATGADAGATAGGTPGAPE